MDEPMRVVLNGESVETTLDGIQEATRRMAQAAAEDEDEGRFRDAPEVEEVAKQLIATVPDHEHLAEARIRYLWRLGGWESKGRTVFGKAFVLPEQQQFLTGADLLVIVNQRAWEAASKEQRQALVDHELSHFLPVDRNDGTRTWSIAPHDLEEFHAVVRRHGLWMANLEQLMQAYKEHEVDRRQGRLFEVPDDGETLVRDRLRESHERFPSPAENEGHQASSVARILHLVEEAWEGTRLPLYEADAHATREDIADAAFDLGLAECMIQVVRNVPRGGQQIRQELLYHWLPDERLVQRVPKHSVELLVRELGGDGKDVEATG